MKYGEGVKLITKYRMINGRGADRTVQMFKELKGLCAVFMCWQPATDWVVVPPPCLTCSVHHHYFGVFLPQEGAEIRAPLAELPLPQTWSRTKRGGGSLE